MRAAGCDLPKNRGRSAIAERPLFLIQEFLRVAGYPIFADRKVQMRRHRELGDRAAAHRADDLARGDILSLADARRAAEVRVRRLIPVSYTHLDVYKRQSGRRCCSPLRD